MLQKLSFAVLAAGALLPSSASRAATETWNGNGANTTFATGFNATPANGDTLVFGPAGSGGTAVSNGSALTVGAANTDGIDFLLSASAFTISGSAITLASSGTGIGINDLALNAQTFTAPIVLASAQTFNVGSIDGSLGVGAISGAFTLTKTGAGLLSLNSTSTFSNLVVMGGVVQAGGDNNIGVAGGSVTLDGGTLRLSLAGNFGFIPSASRAFFLGDAGAGTGGTIDTGNATGAFGGVLANNGGTNSFTKTGTGTLTLSGANTYTGTTFVNQGGLSLDYNGKADGASATYTQIISASSALALGGVPTVLGAVADTNASFYAQGASGGARVQTFAGLTLNPGENQIGARGFTGAGSNMTLAFGAITHNAGGTVSFSNVGAGVATATGLFTTTNVNDASGLLGGWAVVNSVAGGVPNATGFQVPTDYATVNGGGQIVAYTGYTAQAAGAVVTGTATNNRVTTANAALTVAAGTTDINTLSNGAGATGTTNVTIATGGTLRLGASGGLFTASGTGAINVNGGTLTAGGGATANNPGEISLIGAGGSSPFNIGSVIADNGTGAVTLTVSQYANGGNVLTLGNANTYSGGTFLNSGRTQPNNAAAFGTGPVNISAHAQIISNFSGTMANAFFITGASQGNNDTPSSFRFATNNETLSGTITLLGDSTLGLRGATGEVISGKITGNFNLTIGEGNGGGNLTFSNPANNFGGNLAINNEKLILGASNVLPDGSAAGNFSLNNGAALELGGFSDTINGLNGTTTVGQGTVQNTATGASVLTVGGNDQTSTFNGLITDGGAGKTLGITKTGAGLLILGDVANAYLGGTTVNGGTLRLGASSGATNSTIGAITGALTVNTGGTLGLNGFNQTVGAFSGTGGTVTNSSATAATLTVGNATNTTFAGSIQNGTNGGGTVAFTKQGSGTLDLTGANTYTGATSVTAGALQIGSGGSLNAASATTLSGTASLIFGDANGLANQTFNSLTTTATTPVVGGATGQYSTLTLNNAGSTTFANVFGGAGTNQNNLNLIIAGTGTTPTAIFSGLSTYTGFTTVNVGSTLNLLGGSISGSALTLNSGATLTGAGNNSTTGLVGSLTASGGSAITLTGAGGTALRATGAITLGGTGTYGPGVYTTLNYTLAGANAVESLNTPVVLTLNSGGAYVNITNPTTVGTYTLATYASLSASGSFSLSSTAPGVTTLNIGRNTETLTTNATSLVLTIAGAAAPNVAFFNGAVSSVFNDVTTSATKVNFSTDRAGTTDAGNVPSANTDVILVADNAATNRGTAAISATLGTSTTINSLNVISATSSGLTSFTLAADGSTLTIAGVGDSNTSSDGTYTGNAAGNGIRLASGAAPLTLNVPIVVGAAGAAQSWTNNSASLLTVGGTVTGSGTGAQTLTLVNTGTGGMTLNGVIANPAAGTFALAVNSTGSGVTTLGAANTYTGGTTLNGGTLTSTVAGGFGTGSVTVNPTNATGAAADNATLNTTGSIVSTAVVTVNNEAGDGGFGVGTINFNGAAPTIGSLAGNGSVVLNNAAGTALTIGSTNNLTATFSGVISNGAGIGSIVKAGTGTETLSGANTYTGTTTINAGTLALGNAQAIGAPTTASVVFGSGSTGTLQLNGNNVTLTDLNTNATVGTPIINSSSATAGTDVLTVNTANTDTYAGVLQNGGTRLLGVTKSGTGTLALTGTNTYSGGTTVSAGTLATTDNVNAFGSNGTGTTVAIGSAGTVLINVTTSNTYQDTFSGSGLLKFAFNNNGGDTVVNNFNAFTGTLEIGSSNGGNNKVQIQTAIPTNLAGATLQIDNGGQYFTGANVNFGTINIVGQGNGEFRGAIRLNGNGTTSGVIGGNVVLQGNTSIGSEGGALTGNISTGVAGTSTLTMGTSNSGGAATLSGVLSNGTGTLALTQSNGTTTLSGANTYTGATTVTGGTLSLTGTGSINGSLSVTVGSGALTLTNPLSLADAGTLTLSTGATFNLNDPNTSGTDSEIIGNLILNGTTEAGGTYTVAQLGALPGASGITFGSLAGETLTIGAVPEPATWLGGAFCVGAFGWFFRRRSNVLPKDRQAA